MDDPLSKTYAGKRALVTGGLGFIGSNLARRLVDLGAVVSLIDNLDPELGGTLFNINGLEEQVRVVVGDVRDESRMEALLEGQDYLFNLAGQGSHVGSMEFPETDMELNILTSLRTLELCRKVNPGIRIIYTSTRQVYGRPHSLPVDEMHPLMPLDYNGVSKLAGTMYHLVAWQVYGLQTTVLRLTNVYGPRMRVKDARLSFIGWWIRRVIEGQELDVYGDGMQLRDLVYVDDVVRALLLAAADPATAGEVYNLGGGQSISVLDLAKTIIALNGGGHYRHVEFPAKRRRIEIGDFTSDISKIHDQLDWHSVVSLEDGLRRTLAFYRENGAHYW